MEQVLDVSHLEPCEPLQRTLQAVANLSQGDYLRVLHRREPRPLYPMLEQAGFAWYARVGGATGYQILIWRRTDREAEADVARLIRAPC